MCNFVFIVVFSRVDNLKIRVRVCVYVCMLSCSYVLAHIFSFSWIYRTVSFLISASTLKNMFHDTH